MPLSRRPRTLPVLAAAMVLLVPTLAFAGTCAEGGDFASYEAKGWIWMFLGSFGAGFLTSLTPCVYPMIPITLGIFGARGDDVPRARRLALATAYVVGMGLTYAILGVTFAMLGGSAGALLSKPYVVIPLVLLFCAMAASLFGAFELNLPSSWQAKLNQVGGRGFKGAFAMGLVGGFIAAPCTGPFLAGLLGFVTKTRNVVGGGSLLFVYALGMGVLFWVLAAAAMSLPKSGKWMDAVKSLGGVLLLVGAIYFLKPLLPDMRKIASPDTWFLGMAIALMVGGLATGAIHRSFSGSFSEKLFKGSGVVLLLAGVFSAWTWVLTPKKHLPWAADEKTAFEKARAEGKGVMVDFAASWCTPCAELELVFGNSDVHKAITDGFVPVQFDVSQGSDEDMALRARYGAETLPAVVFLDSEGKVLARVKDLVDEDCMLDLVQPAAKDARKAGSDKQAKAP
jgi:thiol:disulfide interchange protein DsbD